MIVRLPPPKELEDFATDLEREVLTALDSHGSIHEAAKALGITKKAIDCRLSRLRSRAAKRGILPNQGLKHEIPDGFYQGKATVHYKDGEIRNVWSRVMPDEEHKNRVIREIFTAVVEPYRGSRVPIGKVRATSKEKQLLGVVPIGDMHLGMLAHEDESGASWDLKQSGKMFRETFRSILNRMSKVGKLIIAPLGDIHHANDQRNVTPNSGHQLDVDSRYYRVVKESIRLQLDFAEMAVEAGIPFVEFFIVRGNHDPDSATWLRHALSAVYEKHDRISVHESPKEIQRYVHGVNLIGFTHGDRIPMKRCAQAIVQEYREDVGKTRYTHIYTGHVHSSHMMCTEGGGALIESVRILPPRDAYAASHGYSSGRELFCDIWDAEKGRRSRILEVVM